MKAAALALWAFVSLMTVSCGDAGIGAQPDAPRLAPEASASSSNPAGRMSVRMAFPSISIPGGAYDMAYPDDGSNRLFVSSKEGRITVFENRPDVTNAKTFLDIRDIVHSSASEIGLLSIAFDPDYSDNGYFYVHYNSRSGGTLETVVSRFRVRDSDKDAGDPESEKEILRFAQPRSNHNGGKIAFGEDGYLYISFGDGGRTPSNAQDRTNLFGSIIRIDVSPDDDSEPYSIPSSNPYFSESGGIRWEIWAYGLRNPWRFSFDRQTGVMWAGDVGQNSYEEVDIIASGRNYGWPTMEGFECYREANCNSTGLEPPLAVYENTPGSYAGDCSITGGYVYRGSRLSNLAGKYIYGDYCSGKIWALRHNGSSAADAPELLLDSELNIASFGEDQSGEVYILTPSGRLYALERE